MKAILLLASLGLVSILGSAKVLGASRVPGLRLLARTGILFLALGALVGHNGLDYLDEKTFKQLGLVVVIGLGWLGFLFGTHLEFKTLRKFPRRLYMAAFTQSMVTFLVVLAVFYGLVQHLGLPRPAGLIAAVIVAATASGTAPASLFMLGSERTVRGTRFELLRFFATIDDLPALIALGILFSFNPQLHSARIDSALFWFLLQISLGTIFGFLLRALKLRNLDDSAGDLVVFGVIGMSSGLCLYLHLSPLFVSAVTGVVAVNTSEHSEGIYDRVARREHAFYVLFLLLSGCLWEVSTRNLGLLVVLYLTARLAGKVLGTLVAVQVTPRDWPLPASGGLGLISQGGLAIAMVVSYHWAFERYHLDWVVSTVLISVVIHELLAPWVELKLLKRYGEI